MDEKEYSVSEAVRLIGVESHVLRYWEEELQIGIRRTSQGHRVYSEENIDTFRRVKTLKEKGIQLKAIRVLLEETGKEQPQSEAPGDEQVVSLAEQILKEKFDAEENGSREAKLESETENAGKKEETGELERSCEAVPDTYEVLPPRDKPDNLKQFELILKQMMEEVVAEQNEKLERAIAGMIRDEIEELYLQYYHMTQEAAASGPKAEKKGGKKEKWWRRLMP